jgi:D-lactate dehydrogenase (cytochrome)
VTIIHTRRPDGARRVPTILTDSESIETVLADAAHFPGGHARGLMHAESEADVAAALALGHPLLAVGAQSSLTGGATPRGELVISTSRLTQASLHDDTVDVGAGLTLDALQSLLASHGRLYPPVPTFTGATIGGVVSCNAAGASTFKYGTTRDWVTALTVVLASGDVLAIRRGEHKAHPDGYFDIATTAGLRRVPIAPVKHPDVPKCSAGFPLASKMDLIDLFIGAEGTLGVVTHATLRVLKAPPATCMALVMPRSEDQAVEVAAALRNEAFRTWHERDASGIDISAIEHADARSVVLLNEDAAARTLGITLPPDTAALLFVTIDLPPSTTRADAWRMLEAAEPGVPATPLGRFCSVLAARGLLDRTELALPTDAARTQQFLKLREAVPHAVNRRVATTRQALSPAISKLAGDFIVPFREFGAMVRTCHEECGRRRLDLAVWGHISDGNVHPNVLPRREADMELGHDALLAIGRRVVALGGSPLAEHGVGRNPLKQQFLELLHGPSGIASMRAVKRALDPDGRLAPGVLFS